MLGPDNPMNPCPQGAQELNAGESIRKERILQWLMFIKLLLGTRPCLSNHRLYSNSLATCSRSVMKLECREIEEYAPDHTMDKRGS